GQPVRRQLADVGAGAENYRQREAEQLARRADPPTASTPPRGAGLASKLNGRIKTQGSLYGGSWQMSVPELKITGNVKQNSWRGELTL
ncbi:hypothetical protein CKQ90_32855, partial [Klebsiella pneumoniae]